VPISIVPRAAEGVGLVEMRGAQKEISRSSSFSQGASQRSEPDLQLIDENKGSFLTSLSDANESCERSVMPSEPNERATKRRDASRSESIDSVLTVTSSDAILQWLQMRFGLLSSNRLINGQDLHDAVSSLGFSRYSVQEMQALVHNIAAAINLRFQEPEISGKRRKGQLGKFAQRTSSSLESSTLWLHSHRSGNNREVPMWEWPSPSVSRHSRKYCPNSSLPEEMKDVPINADAVVPVTALIEAFRSQDLRQIFGLAFETRLNAVKEILLTGDTHRIVAELTCVRIDDLAAPPPVISPIDFIEPVVAFMILANGLVVGIQTDTRVEDWQGWVVLEVVFTSFFLAETCLRMYFSSCREYFCGHELSWNILDMCLVLAGVIDCLMSLSDLNDSAVFSTTLLRLVRLARLSRVVRFCRLKCLKELQLMIRGLLGGGRTLCWAFSLVLGALYIISIFAAMTIGRSERALEGNIQEHFNSVPKAVFTVFRCYTGECFAKNGMPIAAVLLEEYGAGFGVMYLLTYMMVALGLFNVILAVYVDITLKAARQNEVLNKVQHERESIRVAHITKQLLQRFVAAEQAFWRSSATHPHQVDLESFLMTADETNVTVDGDINISKPLFLLIIQDPSMQRLMDDLDIPPDRAGLFDVIDADCKGTLHVTALMQGLLKIRGDVKKSDVVASHLALKAVLFSLNQMREESAAFRSQVMAHLGEDSAAP